MISFGNITSNEFNKYSEYFVADYSEEISKNYGCSIEESIRQARAEIEKEFPGGIPSRGNHLVTIQLSAASEKETIGYLWYSHNANSDHAFICDFFILEHCRNKGYGKASFVVLEKVLLEASIDQIRLRVAYTNDRALKLYKEIGFNVTGINMMKRLKIT